MNEEAVKTQYWFAAKDGDRDALGLYERHYSCYKYADKRKRRKIVGPGEYLMLITAESNALFVWRKFRSMNEQKGVNCAIFRNEGKIQSSVLIKEAMEFAWNKWPGERLYTYVNPHKIRSTNPGYCFLQAGWERCGMTKKRGLLIFEALPIDEVI
jgi:hypothetical protein